MDKIIAASFAETAGLQAMMDAQMIGLLKQGATAHPLSPGTNLRLLDPDTDFKVRRLAVKANEGLHMLANEPSLGFYWIQEHVHRTLPSLLHRKKELLSVTKTVEGVSYDVDDSIEVTGSLSGIKQFTRIEAALKSAIEMKRGLITREKKEEEEAALAKRANYSISQNEIAEGYICPICYYALECQDALIVHWLQNHDHSLLKNEYTDAQLADVVSRFSPNLENPSESETVQPKETTDADTQEIWVIHRIQSDENITSDESNNQEVSDRSNNHEESHSKEQNEQPVN